MDRVVIIGGGPGGYEAALVASQLGGAVTLIEDQGLGGSAVLTGTVPSKTLIATAEVMSEVRGSAELGVRLQADVAGDPSAGASVDGDPGDPDRGVTVDLAAVNARVLDLATKQSADITERLLGEHVTLVAGRGRLDGPEQVVATRADGTQEAYDADIVLVATGSRPRELSTARLDGERILSWRHLYALSELPERLIVVGSGVTGAEFASAYDALGCEVVLVSSRDRVLPGEDADAAQVLEDVFARRGVDVMSR
ncbi:MAG: FAD-dependent oxidoreductase, partial [Janthinobacterium lividum]